MSSPVRFLFADQLGPHFLADTDAPVLLVESKAVFRRRRFHRQKAHLVLSALRHRAAELGDRAVYVRAETYRPALQGCDLEVIAPTSRAARRLVESLPRARQLEERGFITTRADFNRWVAARSGRRLRLEDFYRDARQRTGVLMDDGQPTGGQWNYDRDNRQPPPPSAEMPVPEPWWPTEDDIDEQVRADLDRWEAAGEVRFVGRDGPRRFAATAIEAQAALQSFVSTRLVAFGPYEDAMLGGAPTMAHSLLSAPLNLGLIDPMECVRAAEGAYAEQRAPLSSVEGFIRQLMGWRDYVWHLYWHFGEGYRHENSLNATVDLPGWLAELETEAVGAACLRGVVGDLRDRGWVHHIPRLMVLGNWALQRGLDPGQVTDWFHRCFVDGYDWVMVPNVVGMSQHADGGKMATKPYVAGGSYINRMSDYCGGCAYDPRVRVGPRACPFTAGYWSFLARHEERLARNARMAQAVRGLRRLRDLPELLAEDRNRGTTPP